jgi:hypothetical protein
MTPTISATSQATSPLDAAMFGRGRESEARSDFASVLGRMGKGAGETDEQLARRSAENFVSMTLVQPLLKQLRSSSNAAPPFAPTEGEKQFQGLMDAETAQRIVKVAHFPLVDRITQDVLDRARRAAGSKDAPGPTPLSNDTSTPEGA